MGNRQAILCCKDVINEPFLVINADDYYGKQAYEEAYKYLNENHDNTAKQQIAMVSFVLKNTLSDNGGVTRGVCTVDQTIIFVILLRHIILKKVIIVHLLKKKIKLLNLISRYRYQ